VSDFEKGAEIVRASLEPWRAMGRGKRARASRAVLDALLVPDPPKRAEVPAAEPPRRATAAERDRPVPSPTPETPKIGGAAPVDAPVGGPSLSRGEKEKRVAALREKVTACRQCAHLARTRTQSVFGVGNVEAEVLFVGEAPGADEDRQGEPFVGRAGELLTRIIQAMGYARDEVFIANVLKCRPDMPEGSTGNRKPKTSEMETCLPYLREQIEVIRPKVLVALGATAMEGLTGSVEPMAKLRGRWHEFHGIPLMATYHPAYLLRNQTLSEKRKVWEDMLKVLEFLGKPITAKQRGYFSKA
jgi:DNA polymerase